MKLLLYCTKGKPYLYKHFKDEFFLSNTNEKSYTLNGLIVAECDYDINYYQCSAELNSQLILPPKVDLRCKTLDGDIDIAHYFWEDEAQKELNKLLQDSCLSEKQLAKYILKGEECNIFCDFFAIHIKNLHIFDELMGLSEYNKKIEYKKCENCEEHCKFYYSKNTMSGETNKGCTRYYRIQKAPQNMCYCYDASGNKYVLISIHPEHLCKILNGEKKIEVRKKVLKEMIK